jgi:hypothetical protein
MKTRFAAGSIGMLLVIAVAFGVMRPEPASADLVASTATQQLSLLTETPEEGFALALRLSRMGVTQTQTDRDVLQALRPGYAHNAEALIAVSHVVAVHFQTVAAANDYWRE